MQFPIGMAAALAALCWMLCACGPSPGDQGATAAYLAIQTEGSELAATGTVARARMQTTLDFVGTRVSQVEQAALILKDALIDLGTESAFIEANLQGLQKPANPAGLGEPPNDAIAAATPPSQRVRADDYPLVITRPSPQTSTPDASPRLDDIVLASGVDARDCAIDRNPVFRPGSPAIYVVARAFHIPANATLSATWTRQGVEVVLHSFSPDYAIHDNCIWFFIDPSDTPFLAGSWSVRISFGDQPLMSALPFQIAAE